MPDNGQLTPDQISELQDTYASLRQDTGYLNSNPEIRDTLQSLVKDGTLKDLSGGSTPAPIAAAGLGGGGVNANGNSINGNSTATPNAPSSPLPAPNTGVSGVSGKSTPPPPNLAPQANPLGMGTPSAPAQPFSFAGDGTQLSTAMIPPARVNADTLAKYTTSLDNGRIFNDPATLKNLVKDYEQGRITDADLPKVQQGAFPNNPGAIYGQFSAANPDDSYALVPGESYGGKKTLRIEFSSPAARQLFAQQYPQVYNDPQSPVSASSGKSSTLSQMLAPIGDVARSIYDPNASGQKFLNPADVQAVSDNFLTSTAGQAAQGAASIPAAGIMRATGASPEDVAATVAGAKVPNQFNPTGSPLLPGQVDKADAGGAFGRAFTTGIPNAVSGVAGFEAAAPLGTLIGPEGSPQSAVGGIVAGTMGAMGLGHLLNPAIVAARKAIIGPDAEAALQARLQQDEKDHPNAVTAAGIAAQALLMNPSAGEVGAVRQIIQGDTEGGLQALGNAVQGRAHGAAIQAAIGTVQQAAIGQPITAGSIAKDAMFGGIFGGGLNELGRVVGEPGAGLSRVIAGGTRTGVGNVADTVKRMNYQRQVDALGDKPFPGYESQAPETPALPAPMQALPAPQSGTIGYGQSEVSNPLASPSQGVGSAERAQGNNGADIVRLGNGKPDTNSPLALPESGSNRDSSSVSEKAPSQGVIPAPGPNGFPALTPETQKLADATLNAMKQAEYTFTPDMAHAAASLVQAQADSWAKATGNPASEYIAPKLAQVRGGDFTAVFDNLPAKEGVPDTATIPPASSGDDTALFQQGGKSYDPSLVAIHNTSGAGILAANELGGIPAPSIAIQKPEHALTGFGDITLLGNRQMIDPAADSANKVFDADVYSPRQPRPSYDVNTKGLRAVEKQIDSLNGNRDYGNGKYFDTSSFSHDLRDPERATEQFEMSPNVQAAYLADKGITVPELKKPAPIDGGIFSSEGVHQIASKLPHLADKSYTLREGSEDHKALTDIYRRDLEARYAALPEERRNNLIAASLKTNTDADGNLQIGKAYSAISKASTALRGDMVPDREAMGQHLSAGVRVPGDPNTYTPEYKAWVTDKVKGLYGPGYLDKGGRKAPYTLENLVSMMMGKTRAQEGGMATGLGAIRASGSRNIPSIEAMHDVEGNLVSDEDFKQYKEDANKRFTNLRAELVDTTDDATAPYSSFGMLDQVSKSITDYSKTFPVKPNETKMQGILRRNGFPQATPVMVREATALAHDLHKMPTEYFEAKPQRAVKMSEFSGAVVPHDTPADVRAALQRHGIEVRDYQRGDNESRRAAVKSLTSLPDVLFQRDGNESTSTGKGTTKVDPDGHTYFYPADGSPKSILKAAATYYNGDPRAYVNLFKAADFSSVVHDVVGHVFTESRLYRDGDTNTIGNAAEDRGNGFTRADWEHTEQWAGVKDTSAWREGRKVPENYDAHEKFARGFERYIRDGEAPTEQLKRVFAAMAEWMRGIYAKVKGSAIDVDISPHMRDIFNRILGGEGDASFQRGADAAAGQDTTLAESKSEPTPTTQPIATDQVREATGNATQGTSLPHTAALGGGEGELAGGKNETDNIEGTDRPGGSGTSGDSSPMSGTEPHHSQTQPRTDGGRFEARNAGTEALRNAYGLDEVAKPERKALEDSVREGEGLDTAAVIAKSRRGEVLTAAEVGNLAVAGLRAKHAVDAAAMDPAKGVDSAEYKDALNNLSDITRVLNEAGTAQGRALQSRTVALSLMDTGNDYSVSGVTSRMRRASGGKENPEAEKAAAESARQLAEVEQKLAAATKAQEDEQGKREAAEAEVERLKKAAISADTLTRPKRGVDGKAAPAPARNAPNYAKKNIHYVDRAAYIKNLADIPDSDWGTPEPQKVESKTPVLNQAEGSTLHQSLPPSSFHARLAELGALHVEAGSNNFDAWSKAMQDDVKKAGKPELSQGDLITAYRNAKQNLSEAHKAAGGSGTTEEAFADGIGRILPTAEAAADFTNRVAQSPSGPDLLARYAEGGRAALTDAENKTIVDAFTQAKEEARQAKATQAGSNIPAKPPRAESIRQLEEARDAINKEQAAKRRAANKASNPQSSQPRNRKATTTQPRATDKPSPLDRFANRRQTLQDQIAKAKDALDPDTATPLSDGIPPVKPRPVVPDDIKRLTMERDTLRGQIRQKIEEAAFHALTPEEKVKTQLETIAPTDKDGNIEKAWNDKVDADIAKAGSDSRKLANVLSRYSATNVTNGISGFRAGLLSGLQTFGNIGTSHLLYMAAEEAKRAPAAAADAVLSKMFGTERTVRGADAGGLGRSIAGAATKGAKEAGQIWRRGESAYLLDNPHSPLHDYKKPLPTEYSAQDKFGGAVWSPIVRTALRNHGAFFHVMATGEYLAGLDEWATMEARRQVKAGQFGLVGKDQSKAVADKAAWLRDNPTDEGVQFARKHTAEMLFANDHLATGALNSIRQFIGRTDAARAKTAQETYAQTGQGKGKAFQIGPIYDYIAAHVAPFTKVPTNVAGKALEYAGGLNSTLYAFGRAGYAKATGETITPAQQRAMANTAGRGVTGAVIAALGLAVAKGWIPKFGIRPPDDKEYERGTLNVGGNKGTDYRIGRLQPVAAPFFSGAYAEEENRKRAVANHTPESFLPSPADYARGVGKAAVGAFSENAWLHASESMTDMKDMFLESDKAGASKSRQAAMAFVNSLAPVPVIVREGAAQFDPQHVQRSINDVDKKASETPMIDAIKNNYAKQIPGLRNTLPPQKDRQGNILPESNGLVPFIPQTPAKATRGK